MYIHRCTYSLKQTKSKAKQSRANENTVNMFSVLCSLWALWVRNLLQLRDEKYLPFFSTIVKSHSQPCSAPPSYGRWGFNAITKTAKVESTKKLVVWAKPPHRWDWCMTTLHIMTTMPCTIPILQPLELKQGTCTRKTILPSDANPRIQPLRIRHL